LRNADPLPAAIAVREIDAAGARRLLRDARRLFLPGCSGEPRALHGIVAEEPGSVAGLSVLTSFVAGLNPLDCKLLEYPADVLSFFPAPTRRENRRQIISAYSGIDGHIGRLAPDLVFIPVSPARPDGTVTLGLSAEFAETAMAIAATRVAIPSPALPALAGGAVPLDRFTHVLRDEATPFLLPATRPSAIAEAIADHVATLIGDGAAVQTGVGKVPAALLTRLTGRRRLRIHSGIVTQSVRVLIEAGALDPDIPVCCATLAGDAEFYAWLDGRHDFVLQPIRHTHAPATLAAIDGLVSVNSAIEVDLLGQVNAESFDGRIVSAAGGLPDFAAGAHRSRGGISVIAMPAADGTGRHSRIVSQLAPGAPVSVARHDVDVVVTEYGIADLRGKAMFERALALAAIAHPDARPRLGAAIRRLSG
jgi:4-hydroxybutyrate CoA-transferase